MIPKELLNKCLCGKPADFALSQTFGKGICEDCFLIEMDDLEARINEYIIDSVVRDVETIDPFDETARRKAREDARRRG